MKKKTKGSKSDADILKIFDLSDGYKFIKWPRKLREHPIQKDPEAFHLFHDYLMRAAYRPIPNRDFKGHKVDLEVGQLVTSREEDAISTGMSVKVIRNRGPKLEDWRLIKAKRDRAKQFSLITIRHYTDFCQPINERGPREGQANLKNGPSKSQKEGQAKSVSRTNKNGDFGKSERKRGPSKIKKEGQANLKNGPTNSIKLYSIKHKSLNLKGILNLLKQNKEFKSLSKLKKQGIESFFEFWIGFFQKKTKVSHYHFQTKDIKSVKSLQKYSLEKLKSLTEKFYRNLKYYDTESDNPNLDWDVDFTINNFCKFCSENESEDNEKENPPKLRNKKSSSSEKADHYKSSEEFKKKLEKEKMKAKEKGDDGFLDEESDEETEDEEADD